MAHKEVIVGIDPGKSIGIAACTPRGDVINSDVLQSMDMLLSCLVLYSQTVHRMHVVIEDFVGGGPRNTEAIRALKLIGAAEAACKMLRISYRVVNPQFRYSHRSKAAELLPNASIHARDALAHALAEATRMRNDQIRLRQEAAAKLQEKPDAGQ